MNDLHVTESDYYSIKSKETTFIGLFEPEITNFLDNPDVTLQDNGKDFKLLRDMKFFFWIYINDKKKINILVNRDRSLLHKNHNHEFYVCITIKAGFLTDFVSSPQLLWWLISPLGKAAKPSVLHDLFYRNFVTFGMSYHSSEPGKSLAIIVDQKMADLIFYKSLLIRGLPRWRSKLMYIGLRLFGSFNFHKH